MTVKNLNGHTQHGQATINDNDAVDLAAVIGPSRARRGGGRGRTPKRRRRGTISSLLISSVFLSTAAADCIPLSTSTSCPAFKDAQVSTSDAVKSQFPFLAFVANTEEFDRKFTEYISEEYVSFKYESLFGCADLTLTNTTDYYARYTRSFLCSRMIQDSRTDCGLSNDVAKPICADTCAQFGRSEQIIVSDPDTCGQPTKQNYDLIRSDFTICSNPEMALGESCISGVDNEWDNCGYSNNLPGLCLYCADSSPDSTDTCCYTANAEQRCQGVKLPNITNLPPITPNSTSPNGNSTDPSTNDPNGADSGNGLSAGAIAGVAVGAISGVALLAVLAVFCYRRRRYGGSQVSVFNHPIRSPPSMTFTTVGPANTGHGYEVLAGGRVARMSALEHTSSPVNELSSPPPAAMLGHSRSNIHNSSSSDFGLDDSPESQRKNSPQHRPLHPPPRGRNASLSSTSILMDPTSPGSENEKSSSPREFGSPASEQLPFFKDYYSADDIHPGDRVSTLWAYSPRAPDEFELERGDMLKVVGIWDDGWATGVRLSDRAEEHINRREMRDSGVSAAQSSHRRRPSSPPVGEVKAFPLVCVCLPEHWQKTIESENLASQTNSDPAEQEPQSEQSDRKVSEKSSSRFKDDLQVTRKHPGSP